MCRRAPGGAACRADRRCDLARGEPGRPGGDGESGERGLVASFGGPAGGPEQAVVPVALVLPFHPGGEVAQVAALNLGWPRARVPFGFEQAGVVLCLFEGPIATVRLVTERASLPFERILQSIRVRSCR